MDKQVITLDAGSSLINTTIVVPSGFTDGVLLHCAGDNHIENITIVDARPSSETSKAHCDAIQLIGKNTISRGHYALAHSSDISIGNVKIEASQSQMQGIFSDGSLLINLYLHNITINTLSTHKVTLCGVIYGHFSQLQTGKGEPIKALLLPARIGGQPVYRNVSFPSVYVVGFKAPYNYQSVEGDSYQDERQTVKDDGSIYLTDFDLEQFYDALHDLPIIDDVNLNCLAFQYLALQCGVQAGNKTDTAYLNQYYRIALTSSIIKESDTMIQPASQTMTENGIRHLMSSEGVEYGVYLDSAGLPTIGVGHLITAKEHKQGYLMIGDKKVSLESELNDSQVMQLLRQDIASKEQEVNELVTVDLNSDQFDAIVHFVFNVGVSAFKGSGLLQDINAGNFSAVPEQLRLWNKVTVNGKKIISRGLKNRREKEIDMWQGEI